MLTINDLAPDFTITDEEGKEVSLSSFRGKNLVLYFYPKDNTPGCTQEAIDFTNLYESFAKLNTKVIGVSKDSVSSHKKFKEKYCIAFPLLADIDKDMCDKYGVIKEKSRFGKKYLGIERTSFLIDKEGRIAKIWRNVSVKNHAQEVLDMVNSIAK
jgi:peroxiredoxin Q/BCP